MQITNDIHYIGVNDHDIDLFEGQYIVENGMAYNSYVIIDEKIAVMDTVDTNFEEEWLGNLKTALNGRRFHHDETVFRHGLRRKAAGHQGGRFPFPWRTHVAVCRRADGALARGHGHL